MRSSVASVCLRILLAVACASCTRGEDVDAPLIVGDEPPPPRAAVTAGPEAGSAVAPVDVSGVVTDDRSEPLPSRAIVAVDAHGARQYAVTDGAGRFDFPGVAPPYDLAALPVGGGAATVFLGLRRSGLHVELLDRDRPAPPLARQTVRVGVRAPRCGRVVCSVTAATRSASGAGSVTTDCREGGDVSIDVEHVWRHGTPIGASEPIDVHVLVSDEAPSTYSYGRIHGVAGGGDAVVDAGYAELAPVAATEPAVLGAHGGAGALTDWRWTTAISLDLPGAAAAGAAPFVVAEEAAASTTFSVPLAPEVMVFASVSASHPRGERQGGFFRSTEAWSGGRGPSEVPFGVDVAPGPEIVRPAVGGIFSRRGRGFAWVSLGIAGLATLTVAERARGGARLRVLTSGEGVPLDRLAVLGLPKLDLGDHVLDLVTSPGAGVDDAVSPDPVVRGRREDRSRPGTKTYLRVPFRVTR
ncbi:MAG TPA: carboxypeptidase-like regulatory domain-containing protein [Gaiellaceae bacterium]|nr:carboxypeptidase-like regulatory domain-containing protein [Gaiellaceae bacterium]